MSASKMAITSGGKSLLFYKDVLNQKLLETYNLEREKFATQLFAFDRGFIKMFSSAKSGGGGHTAQNVAQEFIKSGPLTAG